MKTRVNKKSLAALMPVSKRTEIYDEVLPGFVVRLEPSGRGAYYARVRVAGRYQRVKIAPLNALGVEEARRRCRKLLGDAAAGIDPRRKRQESPTLKTFLDKPYLKWAKANLKTGPAIVADMRQSFKALLGKRMDRITVLDLEKWKRALLAANRKPASINRRLGYLRAAYLRAATMGIVPPGYNPVVDVARLKEPRGRVRYLLPEERERLTAALARRLAGLQKARANHNVWLRVRGLPKRPEIVVDSLTVAVTCALGLGLRRGELLGLRWSEVHFERGDIEVLAAGTKTATGRHVPMSQSVTDILAVWRTQNASDEFVFPNGKGGHVTHMNTAFRAVLKDVGIAGLTWHDMRHTFASELVQRGIDLYRVGRLLGHSGAQTTQRYAHLSPEHLRSAVAVLDTPAESNVVPFEASAE